MDDSIKSILLVGETASCLQELADVLASEKNFQVRLVTTDELAFESICNDLPSLVVLVSRTSLADGCQLCSKLKADPKTSHIPVIFVGPVSGEDNIYQAFAAGAADFIVYPFQGVDFLARAKIRCGFWGKPKLQAQSGFQSQNFTDELQKALYLLRARFYPDKTP